MKFEPESESEPEPDSEPDSESDSESDPESESEPESESPVNSWLYMPDWSGTICPCDQAEECTGVHCHNIKY